MTYRPLSDLPQAVRPPRTEADAIIEAAMMTAEPHPLEVGRVYGWSTKNGVERVDLTGDEYRDLPRRKTGTTVVRDIVSFRHYWKKHADDLQAEVYADADRDKVTAVLNTHTSSEPGWGDHRLVYALRRTDAWQVWSGYDGKLLGQVEFAELLEARLPDIAEPDGADLLELAQTFSATTEAVFKSGNILATGERQLVYSEQIQASGGRGGKTITIPKRIVLQICPYEDSAPVQVTARFRYRVHEGTLRLGYVLDQPAEILTAAFTSVVAQLSAELGGVDIMRGTPAQ